MRRSVPVSNKTVKWMSGFSIPWIRNSFFYFLDSCVLATLRSDGWMDITGIFRIWTQVKLPVQPGTALRRNWDTIDCLTSDVSEHRTVRGLWKNREFPVFLKYPQCSSPRRGNAFSLRHVGDARHVGDGRVYPVFIWIRHNWIGAS